jgi:RNA polymerase sigma-70 factor (ECF subfamily)
MNENKKIDTKYVILYQQNQNDFEAFNEIYNFYKNKIYYFGYSFLKDNDRAEEVVQETFVRVIKQIKNLRDPNSFNSWLFRISYSIIMLHYRKENRYQPLDEGVDISYFPDEKEDLIKTYHNQEIIDNVKNSLDTLSDRLKITAELYYFENMKIREISDVLEIPEGTVKTRLKLIKENLQVQLKKRGFKPADYMSLSFAPLMWKAFEQLTAATQLNEQAGMQILDGIKVSAFPATVAIGGAIRNGAKAKKIAASAFIATAVTVVALQFQTSTLDIAKIEYNTDMTRNKVKVSVVTTKDIEDSKVSITFDNNQIDSLIQTNLVEFEVDQNGEYSIEVGDKKKIIAIDTIDRKAPLAELESMEDNKLKLKISDDLSGVDLNKSYVTSNGQKYEINEDGISEGTFIGDVSVHLYDSVGNHSEYVIQKSGN